MKTPSLILRVAVLALELAWLAFAIARTQEILYLDDQILVKVPPAGSCDQLLSCFIFADGFETGDTSRW